MPKTYDVAVFGAGPAGAQCARELAHKGYQVVLVEKMPNFLANNFSSAGSVYEVLEHFDLPKSTISSYWKSIKLTSAGTEHIWTAKRPLGVVFDFAKLRKFLTADAKSTGNCRVLLGWQFSSYQKTDDSYQCVIKKDGQTSMGENILAKILVDATGPARSVLHYQKNKPRYVSATGIEYLVQTDPLFSQSFGDATLQFLLGQHFQPHGYAWIFPMGDGIYKIGTGGYNDRKTKTKSLKYYIDRIIKNYLQLKKYQILDVHGGTVQFRPNHQEPFVDGKIVGVGDAVSSVNALGFEGIRHGLHSARTAACCIDEYLKNQKPSLDHYQRLMQQYFGRKWYWSYWLSRLVYMQFGDNTLDKIITMLRLLTTEELVEILFYYRFSNVFKLVFRQLKTLFK